MVKISSRLYLTLSLLLLSGLSSCAVVRAAEGFASNEELHVIRVEHGFSGANTSGPAEINVQVSRKSAPLALALFAESAVKWNVSLAPGVILKKVLMAGAEPQDINLPANSIPVTYLLSRNESIPQIKKANIKIVDDQGLCEELSGSKDNPESFAKLQQRLGILSGVQRISSFQAIKDGHNFVVDDWSVRVPGVAASISLPLAQPADGELHVVDAYNGLPAPQDTGLEAKVEESANALIFTGKLITDHKSEQFFDKDTPWRMANVHISRSKKSQTIALISNSPIKWKVSSDPGVNLREIILCGDYESQVTGIDFAKTMVLTTFQRPYAGNRESYQIADFALSPGNFFDSDAAKRFSAMRETLKKLTGMEFCSFQGRGGYNFLISDNLPELTYTQDGPVKLANADRAASQSREMHIVAYDDSSNIELNDPETKVQVIIKKKGVPIVLVLTGFDSAVEWEVKPDPGVKIDCVIMSSPAECHVIGLPEDCPVLKSFSYPSPKGDAKSQRGMIVPLDCISLTSNELPPILSKEEAREKYGQEDGNFQSMVRSLKQFTGLEPTSFQGSSEKREFIIE